MANLWDLAKKYGTTGSADGAAQRSQRKDERSGDLWDLANQYAALSDYADSFKRFELGAGAVSKYLQSDSWDDNNNHKWYSDLVSSRQQEIADAMAEAGDNRALKSRLQHYADTYGSLAQGLTDRQSFFGQFQSKADYNSYASASKAARATKTAGKSYDDWYRQANADLEAASGRVTELENRLANATLQASTGMWDENGVYLGEDKAAAEEARRLKAELERARQDEADKRRIGSYAQAWRYEDLPETKGFSSAAAEGLRKFAADTAPERAKAEERQQQNTPAMRAMGTGDVDYNPLSYYRNDTSWREPSEDWTEQEKNTFGYLYAQDPERAYEYGQYINDRNKAQTRYEQEQKTGEWADKNIGTRAASAAAGILTMPAALADYLDYAAEYAARGTVTQRENMSLADYGNIMVGAVSQGLNERYGTVNSKIIDSFGWGDVYQLGVSIGQSMLWGGAGKALGGAVGLAGEAAAHFGSTATLGMFFGSAAKSGFEDARARGVDDGKALWYGFASGIAEAGCEVLSLDKLLTIKSPTSLTKLLKNVLVQSGVEASEELATTICNRISDQLINGDKSEISTKIALGMAKGMSYEEAAKEAEKEWLQSAARDAVGGFLSGGISGGMASGIESLGRYQGNTAQLIDQGLASGGEAEAIARDMQDWMKRGETVTTTPQSAAQTAPLAQGSQSEQSSQTQSSQTQERESEEPKKNSRTRRISNLQAQRLIEAIEETDRSKLKNAVEIRLQEMQESVNEPGKNLSLIAEAVAKSVQGDKLNRVEEEALKNSHFGEHLIHELSAEKLMTGGSIPKWVRDIGAERLGGGLYSDTAEVIRSTLRGEGLKSTQGRVSVGGERVTFTRLERAADGSVKALVTKSDGSTQQVDVSKIDFGYNTLLEDAVKEMAALKSGPAMMAMYREGQDLGAYIDAWQIGEIYGSRSGATLEAAWEDAGKAVQQGIEYNQFKQAFEMGRAEREQRIAEREKEKKEKKTTPQSAEQTAPLAQGSQSEGKVTFDGAEIDGVKYDAVDKKRLTTRQKRQIAALEELAKVTGVNIVFYQTKADGKGRFRGANGAFFNNTIYLDVNAGMRDSRDNLRVAIIRTAAHELTHYIQTNNAEGYEALQGFLLDRLIEWKGRSLKELAEDKLARDTSGMLSMEQAIDEVVADGCEMMLRRSSVATQLARENKSLFERISDWIKGWTQKIRDAFEGVEAYHDEAKAMEQHAAELQKRWDAALLGAIRNDRSGQGTKNTAPEGGAQYQFAGERAENADQEALKRAQEMERQGADNETIRKETGWFRGMDHKWRFEIDDSKMKWESAGDIQFRADHPEYDEYRRLLDKMCNTPELLTEQEQKRLIELDEMWNGELSRLSQRVKNGKVRLGDVVRHEELFKNYPWLKDLRIEFADLGSANGQLVARSNGESIIQINRNLRTDPRSSLVHEIQHAIQHFEGFTTGASPAYWEDEIAYIDARIETSQKLLDNALDDIGTKSFVKQSLELVKAGKRTLNEHFEELQRFKDNSKQADRIRSFENDLKEQREKRERMGSAGYLYYNTAGEIEARDAQYRQRLDSEKRRNLPPNLGDENTVFAEVEGPAYSIKNTRMMTWKKQTESYFSGKLKTSDSLYIGDSGEYVRGVSSSPLYIPTSIVTKAMRMQKGSRSAHAMTDNDIRGLEKGFREAPAVIYNPDRNALIYIAQEAEKGGQIVATFDLNNDLFGENAHKATSIHPRESIVPMLEKLGKDAVIYVQNENKFNKLAGLQSDNPPELLARVELVGNSIAEDKTESKTQLQERDFIPDDRELLLEAAEGGQGGAELQEYRKKAQKLEEHQRRLQRLQEAAESAEGTEKDKITEKLRKTEKSILNAENALRRMEAMPQIKRALEKATAAWRDANPNEAAQTLRRLREQNRTQKELLEYWQAQARRTEPGKETLRKDDIRRVARALLKEHQSEADVGEVSAMLQELGDFMTQNRAGAGVSFYEEAKRRAGRIARMIVRNVYETEDSHAQLRQEVRDYLRRTPIQITDYIRQDMPELDYFRKKHMGVLKLNRTGESLDEVYQSLGDQFGERWFPRDVTAPSDQLNQIVEALERLEPSYYEMYRDYEVREISEIVAGEIIDTLLSGDVRQSETVADRAYQQMQERLQRQTEKQRQRLEEKDKRRQQVLNDAQDEARYRYAELQDEKALRRQMVSEKVHELRERSITRDKEYKARIRIAKAANRLTKYLTENSKEKHVPEKFKAALGQFLLSVDTLSPRAGEKTQQMYIRQMNEIRRAVASNLAFMDGAESDWKGMLMDLPQDLAEVMEKHIDSVQAAIDGDKTWVTARMDLQQLQDLEDILTVLSKAITQQNELLAGERGATVSAAAEETVKYLDALERAKADNALSRFLQWDNTTPYYFFKRFGPAGLQIFRELQDGWGKMAFNSREIVEFAEKTYSAKEVREAERKTYSFQLHKRLLEKTEDGNEALRSEGTETVRMSKAQVMELYALSRREQALGHILGAGIRVSDIQDGTKKITQAENYLLTLEELQEITAVLSERDRAIVDALQKYMNTRGTEWGNEVSMARFGIRQFTEEHYWPIKTDPRGRALRDPSRDSTNLFRLLNMGFTKNTIRDASNSIVLGSAFDTFANHMADMAKYNALGLPLLDAMKWYSYNAISEQNEESGQYTTVSMQKAAERALGKDATSYFITFMKDMNGTQEGGRGEEAAAKMLSNYKVAAVAANLRVAMLQPTAYVRAAAVLDPKYLAKGVSMGNKAGRDKAMKYSGTAVWKDMGFYDTNINTGLREMIKHDDKLTDQVREKSMLLAEWGDKMTWGYLWNACEAEVAEKQHLRGEELMRATAQRFDDVIYRTQVMDSTMTRSQNMRQKGVFAGMATSFLSEPTLSYNMVLDAYKDFRAEKRRSGSTQQAWRKTRGAVGRAMLSYAATAAAAAIVESIADALRDDDEYASFTEKWLEKMGFRGEFWEGNLWNDLAIHNKLPYLRDIDSMLHGFETQRLDMEWAKSVKKAWEIISETVKLQTGAIDAPTDATYNGRMTTFGKIYNVMKALSQLSGLPLGNTLREVQTVWNNTAGLVGTYRFRTYDPGPEKSIKYALQDGNLTEEEAQKLLIEQGIAADASEAKQTVYEWSLDGAGKYDALLGAVKKNDAAGYQSTLKELLSLGYAEKSISSTVKTRIREWYQGTEKEARSIDKAQAVKLLQAYGGMRQREAEETVQEWSCYVVTGIQYGDLKEAYLDGQMTNSTAVERRMRYGGQSREDANAAVLKWQCEKDTGFAYDEIREAYTYGEISEQQLRRMMAKYGGQSEENIDRAVAVLDFAGTDETLGEITGASALWYFNSVQESGIGKRDWYNYWKQVSAFTGDDTQKQVIAYIDGLNLTPAQKDVIFRFMYRNSEKTLAKTPWHK